MLKLVSCCSFSILIWEGGRGGGKEGEREKEGGREGGGRRERGREGGREGGRGRGCVTAFVTLPADLERELTFRRNQSMFK